jgi:phosphatidylserine decarboxylase
MQIRAEAIPFAAGAVVFGVAVCLACAVLRTGWTKAAWVGTAVAVVGCCYMAYFFRDPERTPPTDPGAIVAGADGVIAAVADVRETQVLEADTVRISIFLSLFDVHVNRAPLSGQARFLGYFPGKRFFTFREKSSELNQHNRILITGARTRCLVHQIVGPVCRRVVYWKDHEQPVAVTIGERIGMMKFGSRLDMYLPKDDVSVVARVGDRVSAGETVVARLNGGGDA